MRSDTAEDVVLVLNLESNPVALGHANLEYAKIAPFACHFFELQTRMGWVFDKRVKLFIGTFLKIVRKPMIISSE